ncbi:MAG: DUF1990 family protein, partial [Candidatus Eremiobacteraeota bacterium]|nr:DUF1990 family protein [Candidatus Eremiobacteraeota bacterium]
MQFLLPSMQPDLERWSRRAIHPRAPRELVPQPFHDLMEVTLAVEPEGPPVEGGPFDRVAQSILRYDIFGPRIGQGFKDREIVEPGATVGLKYRFAPFLSMFFASRVVEVFDQEETEQGWRSGFVYQTLVGHPELGEEIFEVTKLRSGPVVYRMEAWSRPNLWFVKIFTPWARLIQKRAARCAGA